MSIHMSAVRGIAAGAVGAGAVTGALLFGALPAAQAAPAPVPQTASVQLADFVSPLVAPEGMPIGGAPMWWGHHHHHWWHHGFGHHHWWNPWRWFWFW